MICAKPLLRSASLLALVCACGPASPPTQAPSGGGEDSVAPVVDVAEPVPSTSTPSEGAGANGAAAGDEVVTAEVVDLGPIGDGACVQRSYAVRPLGQTATTWIHFERCGTREGPDFGDLRVGKTYRFTLRRGASPNFGDGAMILAATATE